MYKTTYQQKVLFIVWRAEALPLSLRNEKYLLLQLEIPGSLNAETCSVFEPLPCGYPSHVL
jgi:hypothetical protein